MSVVANITEILWRVDPLAWLSAETSIEIGLIPAHVACVCALPRPRFFAYSSSGPLDF